MIIKCKNHVGTCDCGETYPELAVNLSAVLESGVVPSTGREVSQNGIESLSDIRGRVLDNFDALELEAALHRANSRRSANKSDVAASAASPSPDGKSTSDGE